MNDIVQNSAFGSAGSKPFSSSGVCWTTTES